MQNREYEYSLLLLNAVCLNRISLLLAGNRMYRCMLWLVKAVNKIYEPVTEFVTCFRQSKENLSQPVKVLYFCMDAKLTRDLNFSSYSCFEEYSFGC